MLAGDRFEHPAGLGAQRLAVLRIARDRLQRTRLPVDPGGVGLLGRVHRVDGLHHLLPAAGTQRCPRTPGQHVGTPAGFVGPQRGALEIVRRLRQQPQRGLPACAGPGPRGQVGRQAGRPGLQLRRGDQRIGGGKPHQRQRGQLRLGSAAGAGLARQEARRVVVHLVEALRPLGADDGHRLARLRAAVDVGHQPRLVPEVGFGQPAGAVQQRRHEAAALVGRRGLRQPRLPRRLAHVVAAQVAHHLRVAGDLAVVLHAKARELGSEVGPVLAAAELEQPVVAQPVLDVGVGPARVEGVEFFLRGRRQAQVQLPVVGPHGQGMLARHRVRLRGGESLRVLALPGIARFEDGIGLGLRGGGQCRQSQPDGGGKGRQGASIY
jgi:hypothetical protein